LNLFQSAQIATFSDFFCLLLGDYLS